MCVCNTLCAQCCSVSVYAMCVHVCNVSTVCVLCMCALCAQFVCLYSVCVCCVSALWAVSAPCIFVCLCVYSVSMSAVCAHCVRAVCAVSLSVCDCPSASHGYLQSSPPVLTTNLSSCEKRMLVTCAECPKYRLCLAYGTGEQLRDGTRHSSVPAASLTPKPFCSLGAACGCTTLFRCCRSFLRMNHTGWVLQHRVLRGLGKAKAAFQKVKVKQALTNFSMHGKSNSLTSPKSSPVTMFRPAWVTQAQLTSALSAFRGQIPMTSSPRMLFQNQGK